MGVLNSIIFLSAFLLFQIELIISKMLLPKFGGSYLVWGAAIVFFQGTLLLGYVYSHFAVSKLGIHRYRHLHLLLLFLSLLFFPGRPLPEIHSQDQIPLVINIFLQLLRTIGPAFFVLSTTSIIFQSWLAASKLPERRNPYILYGISNLGSFAGLLTYPFLFEQFFDLDVQLRIWQIAYWVLVFLHIIALRLIAVEEEPVTQKDSPGRASKQEVIYWLLLSAGATIMFLSVTNIMTYEIAPMPLLWILPLSIYLISFVLNFRKRPWCPAWVEDKFHLTVGFSILIFLLAEKGFFPFVFILFGLLVSLFIICMFCQNRLNRSKPQDSRNLTLFYVVISTGGFLGGIAVSWIAPLLNSASMVEYIAGLLLISFALVIREKDRSIDPLGFRLIIYTVSLIALWPFKFVRYNIFGIILIVAIFKFVFTRLKTRQLVFNISLAAILCLMPQIDFAWSTFPFYIHRNFYGIYKIFVFKGRRLLMHGTTTHGAQYISKRKQREPLTYFIRSSPVGEVMASNLFEFRNIGIIGLGTATLASYTDKEQSVDFFELDPDIYYIATRYFTYILNCPSKMNFILGDARLSLNKIPDKRYDLLVIDAFSGDSVPLHLLTTEAISQYHRCTKDNGLILFHISNRYIDLVPVLFGNACALHSYGCHKTNFGESIKTGAYGSTWFAMTWDPGIFQKLESELSWKKTYANFKCGKVRPWTDKYSNITRFIKIKDALDQIKNFSPFSW